MSRNNSTHGEKHIIDLYNFTTFRGICPIYAVSPNKNIIIGSNDSNSRSFRLQASGQKKDKEERNNYGPCSLRAFWRSTTVALGQN